MVDNERLDSESIRPFVHNLTYPETRSENCFRINNRGVSFLRVRSRPWQLIRFAKFRSSLLALASLDLACRNHCPGVSATLTTTPFDRSGSRWLGISDLITQPEGPSFISRTVARNRVDRPRS